MSGYVGVFSCIDQYSENITEIIFDALKKENTE